MRRLFVEEPMTQAEAAAWATPSELTKAALFSPHRRREWLAWRAVVRRELGREVQIAYNDVGAPVVDFPASALDTTRSAAALSETSSLPRSDTHAAFSLEARSIVAADIASVQEVGLASPPCIHIAVAHCKGRLAVCISDALCAVDIEPADRNFLRAAPRYMTPAEWALAAVVPTPPWISAASDIQPVSVDTALLLPAVVWCAKETLYKLAGHCELDFLRDLHVDNIDWERGTLIGRIAHQDPIELSMWLRDGFVVVYRL